MKVLKDTIKDITYEFKELAKLRGVHFHKFFKFRAFHFDLDGDMDIGPEFTFENFKEIFYDFKDITGNIQLCIAHNEIIEYVYQVNSIIDKQCKECISKPARIIIEERIELFGDFRSKYIEMNTESTYIHIPFKNDSSQFPWNGSFIHIEEWETNGLALCIE